MTSGLAHLFRIYFQALERKDGGKKNESVRKDVGKREVYITDCPFVWTILVTNKMSVTKLILVFVRIRTIS